ncbi:MAG TPA: PorP/SprF family type IX secretion system membrane protein [Bacteroidia bacterium]|nr:PorP/SprF family type IX secretion system membrane protein [Bacteroidia bacterium]
MKIKNIYRKTCCLILLFIITIGGRAQDIHFSQFWMTPLLLNPAQAGAQQNLRGSIDYRNQWSSVAQPYSTGNLSFDMKLGKKDKKAFSGIGLNISQDKSGDAQLKTFQLSVSYACHIHINDKSTIGGGIYAGFVQRSINTTSLQWMNQYDGTSYNASLPSGETATANSLMCFDAGGGLHYEYGKGEKYMTGNDHKKFSAGISMFHLNSPTYSFYGTPEKLYIKTVAYATAELGIANSALSLVPGVVYSQQGTSGELMVGTMFQYQLKSDSKYTGYVKGSTLSLGAYYRSSDAVVATMLLKLSHYAIGFSYDINTSSLTTASKARGGFEVSLRFVNPSPFLYKNASRL